MNNKYDEALTYAILNNNTFLELCIYAYYDLVDGNPWDDSDTTISESEAHIESMI